jgi:hypothetical protein
MEKTPNSNAPTLKLVNGPAGRDKYGPRMRAGVVCVGGERVKDYQTSL